MSGSLCPLDKCLDASAGKECRTQKGSNPTFVLSNEVLSLYRGYAQYLSTRLTPRILVRTFSEFPIN